MKEKVSKKNFIALFPALTDRGCPPGDGAGILSGTAFFLIEKVSKKNFIALFPALTDWGCPPGNGAGILSGSAFFL
ncbi:MAG: hypothetical protein HFF66_06060, partial [Oscillospiraceae bacterium]|nr:hypothetical protein [Oscillospiraceae bacterium]